MKPKALFIVAVCALANLCLSCRDEAVAQSEIPPPLIDERPPGSAPEMPRLHVDTPTSAANQPVRVLQAGENLQNALDAAKPGEVIALTPGAIFTGPFRLREKYGEGWITIRTSAPDGVFPPPGTRVGPQHAPLMPIIESATEPAIAAAPGANHYRFVGIHIRPKAGAFLYNLIALGTNEASVEALPHHIVFERCYVHGDPQIGGRRGIALNSRYTAVLDSYLADFKEEGADSQALCGWNGLGPFSIVNNYLEAAGENLMFGGGDPAVTNLVPSDIEIRRNTLSKPLSWKIGDPAYAGIPWAVKNLLELKNARRVLIDGNVFQNNWPQAQNGFAILFTVRNQSGGAPWSMVQDVTFTHNIVRHTGSAMNILGTDNNFPSQQTKRILIRDNVFEDIDGAKWGGSGRLFQLVSGTADVVIDHNTAFQSGDVITFDGTPPHQRFVYRNNLTPNNQYGVGGSNTYGDPRLTLKTYSPDGTFDKNVMIGGQASLYPPDNFLPATSQDVGFVDLAAGNYRLSSTSHYKGSGTDGKDVGADIDALDAAMQPRSGRVRSSRGPS
jgi:hypothetical protein